MQVASTRLAQPTLLVGTMPAHALGSISPDLANRMTVMATDGHPISDLNTLCQPILVHPCSILSCNLLSCAAVTQVLELLGQGFDNYMPGNDLAAAVDDLLRHNPTPSPGVATMQIGHGTWEVRRIASRQDTVCIIVIHDHLMVMQ